MLSSGNAVAITYAGPRQPLTVAVLSATGGEPRMVGASPPTQFPMSRHVEPTNVVITAADGGTFHNQLFLPPDLQPGDGRSFREPEGYGGASASEYRDVIAAGRWLQVFERWIKTFEATDEFFDRTLIRKEPVRAEAGRAGG